MGGTLQLQWPCPKLTKCPDITEEHWSSIGTDCLCIFLDKLPLQLVKARNVWHCRQPSIKSLYARNDDKPRKPLHVSEVPEINIRDSKSPPNMARNSLMRKQVKLGSKPAVFGLNAIL